MDERTFNALSKLCKDEPGIRADSPSRRPFTVDDGDGGKWTAFTDGHQLAVVRGAHEGVEPYAGTHYNLRDKLLPHLSTAHNGGEEHLADFTELATWLGVPNVDACPVCCQSGHTEADADRLLNITRPNKGMLYGAPLNRNLLAYTFAYLRAEVLQIIVRAEKRTGFPSAMFLFVAPTWRVLLMGMRPDSEIADAFPKQAAEMEEAA